jgi:hypothetical protein
VLSEHSKPMYEMDSTGKLYYGNKQKVLTLIQKNSTFTNEFAALFHGSA